MYRCFYFLRILLISILFPTLSYSSFEDKILGSRILALGGSSSAILAEINGVFHNPASLNKLKSFTLISSYKNFFSLLDLNCQSIVLAYPLKDNEVISLSATLFGNKIYKESSISISHAKKLKNKIYYGINIKYLRLKILEYFSSGVSIDLGVILNINKYISLGFFSKDLNSPYIGEELPVKYKSGILLNLTPKIKFLFDIDSKNRKHLGFEISPIKYLSLYQGFISSPNRYTFGLGLKNKNIVLIYSLISHPTLLFSSQISLAFKF